MPNQAIYAQSAELLRHPNWLDVNSGWGSFRASHPAVQSDEVRGALFRLPSGQRSPWHGASGWPKIGNKFPGLGAGAIYLAVGGEIDFAAGGAVFPMRPRDMVIVNAVVYRYANVGFEDAFFWTLRNRTEGLGPNAAIPPSSRTWEGDPTAKQIVGNDQPYYGNSEPEHFPEELQRMIHVRWDDYRRQPIEWHGEWGRIWGAYPSVDADVSARFLRIPSGQVAEVGAQARDSLLIGVDEPPIAVLVDGQQMSLGPNDAILVPKDVRFQLINPNLREAVVFQVHASKPGSTSAEGS